MHFHYEHGYAIPEYVAKEPKIPRGGTFTTKQARRRTYDDLHSGFSLGQDDAEPDPITDFGAKAARFTMAEIIKLPAGQRKAALKAILAELDPSIWNRTDARATDLRAQGVPALPALEQALAESMSLGLLEEFARVGKQGKVSPKGMLGIGYYGPGPALAGYARAMGGIWGTIKSIGKAIPGVGRTVITTVGSYACTAAQSPAGPAAAGVAGGPAAASGVALLAGSCGGGQQEYYPPPPPSFPLFPILLVGGAIAAILLTQKD